MNDFDCPRPKEGQLWRGVASNKLPSELPSVDRERLHYLLAYKHPYCWMPSSDAPIFAISSAVGIAESWLLPFSYPAAW